MGSSQRFLGREGRSTWSGRDSLKVLAGLAKGEICPNLSCDFIWEKKKRQKRGWRVCPADRPPRRGEGERHASILLAEAWNAGQGFCQKELWAGAELQSRKLLWLHAGSPSPNPPEGKGSLSTRGSHFGALWSWATASYAAPVFIYLSESLRKLQRWIFSFWEEAKASLFILLSSTPLLVGKGNFMQS